MKFLAIFILWCILFALAWPIALLALVMAPLAWLIVLPFLVVGICFGAVLALLRSILFLPARILGYRG
jgi:hypothetical protein